MNKLILSIFCLTLFNCGTKKHPEFSIESPELSQRNKDLELIIIKSILSEINDISAPGPIMPQGLNEPVEEYIAKINAVIDSRQKRQDTTIFEFYVEDVLYNVNYSDVAIFIDSSFNVDSTNQIFNTNESTIDIEKIDTDGFKIINGDYNSIDSLENLWGNFEFSGAIQFSEMIFNEKYTSVIFQYGIHCGRFCGGVFLIKMDLNENKWAKISSEMISVE